MDLMLNGPLIVICGVFAFWAGFWFRGWIVNDRRTKPRIYRAPKELRRVKV